MLRCSLRGYVRVCVCVAIYRVLLRCLRGVCVRMWGYILLDFNLFAGCLGLASLCKCVYSRIGVVGGGRAFLGTPLALPRLREGLNG